MFLPPITYRYQIPRPERNISSLVEELPDFIESTDQVIQIETAAGPGTCSEVIRYLNADAGYEEVYALVLKDTPTVLSMGIAVIEKGWHFEWPARSFAPFAIRPDGTMVWFIVIDYVV